MNIDNVESSGICSCCKGVLTCTYTKNPSRPTWECDDFNGYEPRPAAALVKDILATTDPEPDVGEKNSDKRKGLCVICEDHNTCTFTKPEGGVWHCEEYR